MEFSSKSIEKAVTQFKTLPGIGNKTALRLVLHLLKQTNDQLLAFEDSINQLRTTISYCKKCHNICDDELCSICNNPLRNNQIICVVQDIRDVMAIEATRNYNGLYHLLGGVISPMDGIGPEKLTIDSLAKRIEEEHIEEVIFALSATMEGDTTVFYISRKIQNDNLKISTIARGISVGGELEYVDEITLGRSLTSRIPYKV